MQINSIAQTGKAFEPRVADAIIARCLPKIQGQNNYSPHLALDTITIAAGPKILTKINSQTPVEEIRNVLKSTQRDITIFNHGTNNKLKSALAKLLFAAREEGGLNRLKYLELKNLNVINGFPKNPGGLKDKIFGDCGRYAFPSPILAGVHVEPITQRFPIYFENPITPMPIIPGSSGENKGVFNELEGVPESGKERTYRGISKKLLNEIIESMNKRKK